MNLLTKYKAYINELHNLIIKQGVLITLGNLKTQK